MSGLIIGSCCVVAGLSAESLTGTGCCSAGCGSGMSSGELGRYVRLVSDILTLSGAGGFEWDDRIKLAGGAFGTAVLLGVALIDDEAEDGLGIVGTIGCWESAVENSDGRASALGNCSPLS